MFDELTKYQIQNHFSFSKDDVLGKVCNAPKDKSGIYIVFAIINETPELVYIGSSGKMRKNGSIKHRNGGLFNRIVEGKQFGKKRKLSWKNKLIEDNIESLDIHWYDTFTNDREIPLYVEGLIIQKYFTVHNCLPIWNVEF